MVNPPSHYSPDGHYAWDGAQWVPVAPPPLQYSPDGLYAWDGYRWLPVAQPGWVVPRSRGIEALHGCALALLIVGWVCFVSVALYLLISRPLQPDSADIYAAVFGVGSLIGTVGLVQARRTRPAGTPRTG